MRLSFVIPAFNEEASLGACIESILAQITPDLERTTEIIVVNNASTDRTREVALSFSSPLVKLVDEPRKGLPQARQAGFLASSGALIANVDADSRLTSGWIAQVLQTFATTPRLAALSGPVIYYGLTPTQNLSVQVFYLWAWIAYAINRYILRVGSMVQGGNFIIARAALEQIGGFNLGITFYGEDTDVARRLNHVGIVRFTFDLKMFTSPRRLLKEGMLTTAARYSINYFWTTFMKRPFTNQHNDIREAELQPDTHA
jgi:glycosyltransferase involved in cell wall biosynthesis